VLFNGCPDGRPRSPRGSRKAPGVDMTFAAVSRQITRMAPALLLMAMTGLVVTFAAVGLA